MVSQNLGSDQLHTEDSIHIQNCSELFGSKFVQKVRRGHTQHDNRTVLK